MQQQNLKILVLAKQVPDTRNVGKDAMTPEGTVNRAALPAIFNPEDLNALEAALRLKDRVAGSTVHILTMGPQRAADIIRDAMFRGADGGYLLSGREFAGSDTLATSYALSCALKKIAPDVIFAGRQAIDGDTAQVGPQVAEKLGLPQVTYAEEILEVREGALVIKRRLEHGTEVGRVPDSGRCDGQRLGRRVPPAQRQARDEVQGRAGRFGDRRRARIARRAARRREGVPAASWSGPPPMSIPIPRSSASRVRPRRSRGSRTWFSPPRRPRNSLPPTTTSMNLWLNSSRATRSVNALF